MTESPHADAAREALRRRLDVRDVGLVLSMTEPPALAAGHIDRGELVVVVGKQGMGKSTVLLDLGCATAAGVPWLGSVAVEPGPVIYIVAEGRNSIRPRLLAWMQARNVRPAQLKSLVFLYGLPDLGNPKWVEDVETLIDETAAVLVGIDTLNAASPGRDESSARDIGILVQHAQRLLLRPSRPAVILLHHPGKDPSKGARGSSALPAATDVELTLTGSPRALTLTSTKQRNRAGGVSLVVSLVGSPPVAQPKRWSLAEIIHAGIAAMPNGELVVAQQLKLIRVWAASALPSWSSSAGASTGLASEPTRQAIHQALETLEKAGIVNRVGDVWRLTANTNSAPGVNFLQSPARALQVVDTPSVNHTHPFIEGVGLTQGVDDDDVDDPDADDLDDHQLVDVYPDAELVVEEVAP